MILALLHLTDFHFNSRKGNPISGRVTQIIAALQATEVMINTCLIVVSGDVANSGKREEYDIAHKFFSELLAGLSANYGACPIIIAPGNHDCDFSLDSDLRKAAVQSVLSSKDQIDPRGRLVGEVLRVQENFFSFWKSSKSKDNGINWLVYQEQFNVGGHKVVANCLNTAFLLTIKESQGSLRFPTEIAAKEIMPIKEADVVLSVFHHPYTWIEHGNSRALKNLLESTSDIVLTGHEHIEGAYEKDVITGQHLEYVEGAVLQTDDGGQSGFNVVLCDIDKKLTCPPFLVQS